MVARVGRITAASDLGKAMRGFALKEIACHEIGAAIQASVRKLEGNGLTKEKVKEVEIVDDETEKEVGKGEVFNDTESEDEKGE